MVTILRANWDLEGDEDAPRRARHLAVDTLAQWGAQDYVEDAALMVSELVTNAVIHAGTPSQLELQFDQNTLWIGVLDHGPGEPSIRQPGSTGGWGLRLVDITASAWGTIRHSAELGKTVWCELIRPEPA